MRDITQKNKLNIEMFNPKKYCNHIAIIVKNKRFIPFFLCLSLLSGCVKPIAQEVVATVTKPQTVLPAKKT